ncbi:hypothetical protein [Anaerospora sp.]|uniref:hypothetical protein n=1 Tax=Anaerospora sp. TaxID=1960278 RepID=UPI002899BE06|nr:hypothetical protein [Anaerospora sp.]
MSGIRIFNNSGIAQIDARFKNIQFIDKTQITLTTEYLVGYFAAWGNTLWNVRATKNLEFDPLKNCLLALRCENGKFISWKSFFKVLQYPPWIYGNQVLNIVGEMGAVVTIYRFSYESIPPGKVFEVRNTDEELVFSDNTKFMKVIDSKWGDRIANFSPAYMGTVFETTNHSPSIKTAIAGTELCWNNDLDNSSKLGDSSAQSFRFNSASTESLYPYYVIHEDPHNFYYKYRSFSLHYNYLVLDVTDL